MTIISLWMSTEKHINDLSFELEKG